MCSRCIVLALLEVASAREARSVVGTLGPMPLLPILALGRTRPLPLRAQLGGPVRKVALLALGALACLVREAQLRLVPG